MSIVVYSPSLAGIPTLQLPFFPPKPGFFLFSCFPIPPSFSFILTIVFLIHYFRILINFRCSSQVQEFQIDFLGRQIPLLIAARELDCSSVLGSQCVLQILLRFHQPGTANPRWCGYSGKVHQDAQKLLELLS